MSTDKLIERIDSTIKDLTEEHEMFEDFDLGDDGALGIIALLRSCKAALSKQEATVSQSVEDGQEAVGYVDQISGSTAIITIHKGKSIIAGQDVYTSPQPKAPDMVMVNLAVKVADLVGAVRSINRGSQQKIIVPSDDEPCYWQRKEWIDYILEIADETEQALLAASKESE